MKLDLVKKIFLMQVYIYVYCMQYDNPIKQFYNNYNHYLYKVF